MAASATSMKILTDRKNYANLYKYENKENIWTVV